ncbi:uncharacterized protein LOC118646990 [Monomorium pharaonis]|uniref:uncharacterized protein LOC118646990 n=1 Tax=Monomorium pharaonis TaxID=307658 RepID=UPI001746FE69|nr:uncharacterized protein LOC118646990 [Monomorium pharaonis]XP_036146915.1 uncharacterized protein LOC118646990 [Monomorium pharaonis]XP_036146916.1 uncharacterized protein LOC118646990 [Monomorium pharaonis]XP_036146917.1 uncharacterized protein LOC118646990 [Monomorium pharaonis]XP_036146918.1 uncharacterized protein LOC118646990 [Monomorium pharaonis]
MPKIKKTKFYSCQHRNKRLEQAVREIEIDNSHNELENETETSMSESANSSDRQLCINEDVSFELEYNEACNRSIQDEVQEVLEEEEIEEEEEEAISSDEYDSEDSLELERDIDNRINIDRLKTNLVQWSHKNNINISAVTNLLHTLRKENVMKILPRDGRTLLKTPKKSNVIPMEHGQYCHFGIEEGLRHIINVSGGFRCLPEEIHLSVNIDGLPLAKSSKSQLWPILGSFRNFVNKSPFLIGAFHGYEKPAGVELFLHYFIEEATNLVQNGFTYADNNIPFYIDCFICDAPARAYICCIKGHSGYYGCPKCETRGIYRGKVVFVEMNAPLRTAESFVNQTQAQHHTGISPLLQLNIDMISQIPLDYMHLVVLGQVKKMLKMMTGNLNPMKLGAQQVVDMSRRQLALRAHIPFEFARKPRSLDELDRMKATEHREFALYTGGVVLRKIVRQGVYEHFLKLSVAIRILATPGIDMEQNRYAKRLLEEYFTDFLKLYGENNATYNTHGLLHLADDALKWGTLDAFSAFIFENYLQQIKKIMRKNDKPLQQLSNRISEIRNSVTVETVERIETYKLGKQCYNGCLINDCTAPMYKKIQFQYFTITTKAPNNCCIMKDESIVIVSNICHRNNRIVIIGKTLKNGKPFFNSPAPSTCFGILQFSGEYSSLRSFPIEDIQNKGVVLPIFDESYAFEHRNNIVVFPLIHSQ